MKKNLILSTRRSRAIALATLALMMPLFAAAKFIGSTTEDMGFSKDPAGNCWHHTVKTSYFFWIETGTKHIDEQVDCGSVQ